MATKNTKKVVSTSEVDTTLEQQNNSSELNNNLDYSGNVQLTLKKGTKTIFTKNYHNSGEIPLFKFFGQCLIGNYTDANLLRPYKLKIFNNTHSAVSEARSKPATAESDAVTTDFISIEKAAEIQINETNKTCSALFTFNIPYSMIKVSQTKINQINLYGLNETNNSAYSAIYFLTKTRDNVEEWDPINLDKNNTFNLIIQWEMVIANKQ